MAKCHHGNLENKCGIYNPVSMADFEESRQDQEEQLRLAYETIKELKQEVIDLSEGIATDPTWQALVHENTRLKDANRNLTQTVKQYRKQTVDDEDVKDYWFKRAEAAEMQLEKIRELDTRSFEAWQKEKSVSWL